MVDRYNDNDGLGIYIITNNEKKYITDIESDLIDKRYSYNIETGEFERGQEAIDFEKQALENQKAQIEKELVEVNGLIEGAKKLKEMGIFNEDDEIELVGYETKAQELIIKRSEIKAKLKELL